MWELPYAKSVVVGRERLQNEFSDLICSGVVERIDGDGLWLCFSFIIITEVGEKIGSYMERNR